jgi:hypothetical protein
MSRARQAAEALFAAKPPVTEKPSIHQPDRQPRVLETALPAPVPREVSEAAVSLEPPMLPAAIPAVHFARIRSWVKYGMTFAQVAEVYRVPVDEVARIFGKS